MDDDPKKDQKKDKEKRSYVTQALGNTITKLTRTTYGKRGFADGEILHRWSTIVGDLLAKASHPEKISYPTGKNGDGTLYLRVGNPGLALDIQHMEPIILDRINAHFGYRAISRLKMIQAPLPEIKEKTDFRLRALTASERQSLDGLLNMVDDRDLKKVLENLGQAVTGRTKT